MKQAFWMCALMALLTQRACPGLIQHTAKVLRNGKAWLARKAHLSHAASPLEQTGVSSENETWNAPLVSSPEMHQPHNGHQLPLDKQEERLLEYASTDKPATFRYSGSLLHAREDSLDHTGHQQTFQNDTDILNAGSRLSDPGSLEKTNRPTIRPGIVIQCFGRFVVRSTDYDLTPIGKDGVASYKSWEVLALLAAHPNGSLSRRYICTILWPDVSWTQSSNRLRSTLSHLREILRYQVPELAGDIVKNQRDGQCRLDPAGIVSDVHQFLACYHTAATLPVDQAIQALQRARALYHGDLLSEAGMCRYAWVDAADETGRSLRERYRCLYKKATYQLAQLYEQTGQAPMAVLLRKDILEDTCTAEAGKCERCSYHQMEYGSREQIPVCLNLQKQAPFRARVEL